MLLTHVPYQVRGRIFVLDASDKIAELEKLEEVFVPGTVLRARVVQVNAEKRTLDLSRRV